MRPIVQSRKYKWMFYIKYPSGGRSQEFYNKQRASWASFNIWLEYEKTKITNEQKL